MTRFAACLPLILKHEGGYSDHPRDPGGATNLGVTLNTLSDWRGEECSKADVKALTKADVAPIYESRYWKAAHCHELPAGVDYITFDLAVNSGPGRAVKFLQRAVGAVADGEFGPATRKAVAAKRPADIIASIYAQRRAFYQGLPTFVTFGKGWMRRLDEVFHAALSMAKGGL